MQQIQDVSILSLTSNYFDAYLVSPSKTPVPGIILVQEIFGINSFLRQVAHMFAEAGYVTIVPDLFWRFEPGIQLDDQDESDRARAFELYEDYSEQDGVNDLTATLHFLRRHPDCNGKIGCVGFCLGGKLAYLVASQTGVDCGVSYYGVGIENDLNEKRNIRKPFLMHIAEQDMFVPADAQEKIRSELQPVPLIELHTYPATNHAFARVGGNFYNEQAAELANRRTLTFLQKNLKEG